MPTVVEPPDEIKNIIEKTAEFVARLGATFEKKITDKEAHNPKFSFLQTYDTYYGFYQQRLKHWRDEYGKHSAIVAMDSAATSWQGSSEPPPPPPEEPLAPAEAMKQEGTIVEPAKQGPTSLSYRIYQVQKKIKAEERKLEPPPENLYVRDLPPNLNTLELDIIRLTAQFVARNGHQFQIGLMNREQKNAQFDFLKPNNPFNPFFLGLVDSYTRCALAGKGISEKLMSDYGDKQDLLDRLIIQHEWEVEEAKKQKSKEEKEEQVTIDWHDFVVVETITFEDEPLPRIPVPEEPTTQPQAGPTEMDTDDIEMDVEEPVPKKPLEIKVRKDYVKPTLGAVTHGAKFQKCPQCGQDIPVDEMERHIKIELLDPKYRSQRLAAEEKNKNPVMVSDDEITQNLGAFAKKRADIFGETEEVTKVEDKPAQDKVIWDGHAASIAKTLTAKNIEESRPPPQQQPTTSVPTAVGTSRPPAPPQPSKPSPSAAPPPPPVAVSTISKPPQGPAPPPRMMNTFPAPIAEEPKAKKPKIEEAPLPLQPEESFLAKHSVRGHTLFTTDMCVQGPFTLQVQCPVEDDKPEWKLVGQSLSITLDHKDTVKVLKEKIKDHIGIPPNKQKLKGNGHHLKDTPTMAFYNFTQGSVVSLSIRERGGKR